MIVDDDEIVDPMAFQKVQDFHGEFVLVDRYRIQGHQIAHQAFPDFRVGLEVPGEITVGTAINIEHRAASGVGAHILAEAVLESFDGRFYTLQVRARDDVQEIGRGTVNRAAVRVARFLDKMKAQLKSAR